LELTVLLSADIKVFVIRRSEWHGFGWKQIIL